MQSIIDLRETYGVFRRNCRVVPMASDHMNIPRRLSGITAYAVGDNAEITASDKTWNNVEMTAKKWGVLVKYSSELAEDAFISLADDLAMEMAWAFAKKEDECGFVGTGTSTYAQITGAVTKINDGNHAGSIVTALTANTAFSTLDLVDFEAVVGKLPLYAQANARWYISKAGAWSSMFRLQDAAGGNSNATLANGPSGATFLGYPVEMVQVMNSTLTAQTSTVLCLFGDLSLAATMGERRAFSVMVSDDRYMEYDQIGIKATTRSAISVHDLGDASDPGPIVALKTPAS